MVAAHVRRRALRAARAVTLTFALASGACTADTGNLETDLDDSGTGLDAMRADLGVPDTGVRDTGVPDTGVRCPPKDGICANPGDRQNDPDCCETGHGEQWICSEASGGTCAVPGPFVPPAFEA